MNIFLADESVDFRLIKFLREKGYTVDAIFEKHRGTSDEEVIRIANNSKSILLTEDKDFGELTFRLKKTSLGIILIRLSGIEIDKKREILLKLLTEHQNELSGKFIVVAFDKIRMKNIQLTI